MQFTFTVTAEVERVTGKFASREEIAEQILEALEGADPGSISGVGADGSSEYEVTSFDVQEETK